MTIRTLAHLHTARPRSEAEPEPEPASTPSAAAHGPPNFDVWSRGMFSAEVLGTLPKCQTKIHHRHRHRHHHCPHRGVPPTRRIRRVRRIMHAHGEES